MSAHICIIDIEIPKICIFWAIFTESSTESRESTPMETTDSGDDTSSEHSSSVEMEMEWESKLQALYAPWTARYVNM